MNRLNALTIQLESWMLNPEFAQYIEPYQIEATDEAALRGEIPRIWIGNPPENIFLMAQGPMNILKNLKMWYDNGTAEIRINEDNYHLYDSSLFYKNRKGIYDSQ